MEKPTTENSNYGWRYENIHAKKWFKKLG